MIPAVNLLPWRDGQRRRRNRLFGLQLGGVFAGALALVVMLALHQGAVADGQGKRNGILQRKLAEFDRRIEEVERLRQRQREMGVRIEAIRALEARRGTVARMLEEVANTLPMGVHFQAMDRRGDVLALRGVASSSQDVSALLRNLQECHWFSEPRLLNIKDSLPGSLPGGGAIHGQGGAMHGQGRAFSMTVVQVPLRESPRCASAPDAGPPAAAVVDSAPAPPPAVVADATAAPAIVGAWAVALVGNP